MEHIVGIKEGLSAILKDLPVTRVTSRKTLNSQGYILAEDITAPFDYPPFTRSRMDGYGVVSGDFKNLPPGCTLTLKIKGTLGAGSESRVKINPGETVRIMTGAVLPRGVDAVVPFEMVHQQGGYAQFTQRVKPGDNISPAGEDFKKGRQILFRGGLIRPGEAALLASLGKARVKVYSRPRVGVLATGEELMPLNRKREFGKIYNSNSYMVSSQVALSGGVPVYLGIAGDKKNITAGVLKRQMPGLSVFVTTGGAARGEYDLTEEVFLSLGAKILFNRVSMKPGNYMVAARKDGFLFFGLSGSPSAAFVSFQQLVRPVLWRLQGCQESTASEVNAQLVGDIKGVYPQDRYYKANTFVRQGVFQVEPTGYGFSSFARVNSLIHIPPGKGPFGPGDEVQVQLMDLP
ncbi:molybdopterin molybdotransferase MoeA [Candidatus Contubernalis alkaliaceticus]|uniref:molybdopterin molybdotransferase MoeA n=1 Tax=Candidatus Contubernalis alkaliaceticus TaxID=338645 RepID=UPI001F4C09DE|nr:gephyrin-like molybdotransferase Glp [Candidatus Contubernalis alkalaceticus]UNC93364.1 molybdopterin molybdotransferase MoeA [Candidatus Contubernalis alkalaceticus]